MFPRGEEREIEEIQISCKFSIRQGKSNLKRFPLERPINPPIMPKPVNPVINGNIIDWQQQSLSKISDLQQNRHRYCYFYVEKVEWGAYSFSSLFILNVTTLSQKDLKLFSTTYNFCSKKIGNKKIEGSPTRIMPVTQTAKKIFKQFNFDMENASNECIASQRKFILNICFLVMTYNFPLKLVSSLLTLKCFKTFSKR